MNVIKIHAGSLLLLAACLAKNEDASGGTPGIDPSGPAGDDDVTGGTGTDGASDDEVGDDDASPSDGEGDDDANDDNPAAPPIVFDLGVLPDGGSGSFCGAPPPETCDDLDDDPIHALGLNCPGGPQVDAAIAGDPQAFRVFEGNLGTSNPPEYPPREGSKVLIMSTGLASQLDQADTFASTDLPGNDPGNVLPAPLVMTGVSATETCADNPALVGTGECSNTLEAQWSQGTDANDYAEVRITTQVPVGTFGFSYDFAFFSEEYPTWFRSQFNDMYCAWLESELWTGNISFDEQGNPISLNAGFLDNLPGSPALAGTAMDDNAGTKWLTTTAGVTPGEPIEVVFAVWDLSDGAWDTYMLLDNWLWECEGGPPVTIPG